MAASSDWAKHPSGFFTVKICSSVGRCVKSSQAAKGAAPLDEENRYHLRDKNVIRKQCRFFFWDHDPLLLSAII